MDEAEVLAILDQLDAANVGWWLDGGWGVDALLGATSRPHGDLDIVISQPDCPRAQECLRERGYSHDLSAKPGLPARIVLRDNMGHEINVHPIVIGANGDGWQPLGIDAWGAYPADGLSGEGIIGGRRVRCTTPQLQLRHHLGYSWTAKDRQDLELLAERFGLTLPPRE
jgi:lincosamide nucleotidyltransferase A/C/D/E